MTEMTLTCPESAYDTCGVSQTLGALLFASILASNSSRVSLPVDCKFLCGLLAKFVKQFATQFGLRC